MRRGGELLAQMKAKPGRPSKRGQAATPIISSENGGSESRSLAGSRSSRSTISAGQLAPDATIVFC
jgi:hypothetical protein